MGRRPAILALAVAGVLTPQRDVPAQDSGGSAVDVQVRNRTTAAGTLDPPSERDTFWIGVPAGARLRADAKGARRGPAVSLAIADVAGVPIVSERTPRTRGERREVAGTPETLVRIDLVGDGVASGDYRFHVSWETPRATSFERTAGPAPLEIPFAAEAGTKVRARLTRGAADGARVAAISGPTGALPLRFSRGGASASATADATGTWTLAVTAIEGTEVAGRITLTPPRRTSRLDVTRRSKSVGNGRFVSRIVGATGSALAAPRLGDDQLVTVDVTGVAVDLPAGALPIPTVVSVGPAKEIADPTGATSPAGVAVRFEAERTALGAAATITLPFDAGAFLGGTEGLVVVTRDDDGTFRVVPGPYTVDPVAGTVTFPTPHFSSYGVAQPALELVVAARTNQPQAFATAPDGTVYVLGFDTVSTFDPDTGAVVPFAGRGYTRDEGSDRLDFAFAKTDGADVLADGSLLVCDGGFGVTGDGGFADYPGDLFRIAPDGAVRHFAGNGVSHVTVDGAIATETGLEWPQDVAVGPDGAVFVLVAPVFGPTSGTDAEEGRGKVLRIDPGLGTVRRVAGGGESFEGHGEPPLEVRLTVPGSLLVDRAGRVLVGTGFEVYRFDLALDRTDVIAGSGAGSLDVPTVSGLGAPLRNVSFGRICGLTFDPASEDVLLASDDFAGVVWRLDLAHDRAHIAAGRQIGFEESIRFVSVSGKPLERDSTLRAPGDALRIGDRLFIAETFGQQIRELRPKQ